MKRGDKGAVSDFIARVLREARMKPEPVAMRSMGVARCFVAYDWGCDTFVFEKDVWKRLAQHVPVLIVSKGVLAQDAIGRVMTITAGNHSTAAIPLLSGRFWNLGQVVATERSKTIQRNVVCANVVNGRIEVSQREVSTALVTDADEWLQSMGFSLGDIIMAERNDQTLGHYRGLGQEWRVKPLAWTTSEMQSALATSRTRINSGLRYYHSAKGVHFLAYTEFHKLLHSVTDDLPGFIKALGELVAIFEAGGCPCLRTPKYHGHNEIELFGLRRGIACERLVPELEKLWQACRSGSLDRSVISERMAEIDTLFKSQLERLALADEQSADFIETMYMHLTGEIYHTQGAAILPAFDDRRTALPGATFRGGRPDFHPGADDRTQVILNNIGQMISQDELIEYANIYEVRSASETNESQTLGTGVTREIVFKTNRRPLRTSFIEKRLKLKTSGYGSYMLARVEAFKALGVGFGEYRLLMRHDGTAGRQINYFIRNRCPGEPLDDIPAHLYQKTMGTRAGLGEEPEVVLKLGELLGSAAAQNIALKKYLPEQKGCRFGEGKEIFEFGYDIAAKREMPRHVMLCSIRGSLGWEDTSFSEDNLTQLFHFYFAEYARVLWRFWQKHSEAVRLVRLEERFFEGFEFKTREMHWNYSVRREQFDAFDPQLPKHYGFARKWRFALWSLGEQLRHIDALRTLFNDKLKEIAHEMARESAKR